MAVWDDTAERYADAYIRSNGKLGTIWLKFYEDGEAEFSFKRAMNRIDDWSSGEGMSGYGPASGHSCSYMGNTKLAVEIYSLWLSFYRHMNIILLREESKKV